MAKKELIASYPQRQWAERLAKAPAGTAVEEVYKCVSPPLQMAGAGDPYLGLDLYDVTDGVPVRVFYEHFRHCQAKRGQTVELKGELRRGERAWWVVATSILPKPIEDIEMVTPVAYRPIEDLETDLEAFAGSVEEGTLYWRLLALFLDDEEFRDRFRLAPRSDLFQQSYVGAVLEEAVRLVKQVKAKCDGDGELRESMLIAAAILQGIGALEAYEERDGCVVKSGRGNADKEIFIVRETIRDRVRDHDDGLAQGEEPIDVDSKEFRAILHCITAVHGRDLLPDGQFKIREAKVLHEAAKVVRA